MVALPKAKLYTAGAPRRLLDLGSLQRAATPLRYPVFLVPRASAWCCFPFRWTRTTIAQPYVLTERVTNIGHEQVVPSGYTATLVTAPGGRLMAAERRAPIRLLGRSRRPLSHRVRSRCWSRRWRDRRQRPH